MSDHHKTPKTVVLSKPKFPKNMAKPYFREFGRGKRNVRTTPHHSYGFRRALLAKPNSYANTIFTYQGSLPFATTKTQIPKNMAKPYFREFGRGKRNRTLIRGFGDRYSTVELCPCFWSLLCLHNYATIPIVCARIAHPNEKASRKSAHII